MQKKIAKSLTVGALALTVGLTSFGSIASAKSVQAASKAKVNRVVTKTTKKVTTAVKSTTAKQNAKNSAAKTKAVKAHKRTIPGKVVSVGSGSIKMTSGNKTYTVSISSASVLDRNRKALDLSSINVGDKINVAGLVSGTTVTAQVVRDITLPKSTTETATTSTN